MKRFKVKKYHGNIELSAFGLDLKINPRKLVQTMMNENSQKILDRIIEVDYKYAIKEFELWYIENKKNIDNENSNGKSLLKNRVEEIQNLADFSRDLIPLHSDGEIDLSDDEIEIVELAYSFWKYKTLYGFKEINEVQI